MKNEYVQIQKENNISNVIWHYLHKILICFIDQINYDENKKEWETFTIKGKNK